MDIDWQYLRPRIRMQDERGIAKLCCDLLPYGEEIVVGMQ